jgi:acetylornithine deacetylase/succinyl-diaminopimelate desuccinylase-like protein
MAEPPSSRSPFSRRFILLLSTLALAAVALLLIRFFQPAPSEDRSYIPRHVEVTEEVRFLQQYVRIDTSNPPGRERKGAEFVASYLRQHGIAAELIESAPGRLNVYARIKGSQRGGGLLLMHHIDVVPPDPAGWSRPPFSGVIDANTIWGRGTLDMKGVAACHIGAFLAVAKRGTPLHDLVFLGTADEEEGSRLGTPWLVQNRPDIFRDVRYALTEGGLTEIVADRVQRFSVEIGSRQFVTLRATAADRDRLRRMRIALEPYALSREPGRILPEVREEFAQLAPTRPMGKALLEDIDSTIAHGKFWLLEPAYRAVTQNNIDVSGVRAEGDHYVADIVIANLPDEDPAASVSNLRKLVEPFDVAIDVVSQMGPMRLSSAHSSFFPVLDAGVRRYFDGVAPVGHVDAYSTNDCRFLRNLGVDCLGVPSFRVNWFQSKGIHGANEGVRLDWFVEGVAFTRAVVLNYEYGDN